MSIVPDLLIPFQGAFSKVFELPSTHINYSNHKSQAMNDSLNATHFDIADAQSDLIDALKQLAISKPVILHQDGKQVAALISIEDLHLLELLIEEEEDCVDIAESKEILAEVKEQGTTPWQEIKEKLGL